VANKDFQIDQIKFNNKISNLHPASSISHQEAI